MASLLQHCTDQITTRLALVANSAAALAMASADWGIPTVTWNTSCWLTKVVSVDLSAHVLQSTEFAGKYGGVLIAPDLILGAEHAGFGTTIFFANPSGTVSSRTVVGSTSAITGLDDALLIRLNAPLTSGQGFTPMKLISAQQVQDYMPSLVNNNSSTPYVPVFHSDQDKHAHIKQTYKSYQPGGSEWAFTFAGSSLAAVYNDYFQSVAVGGDSGHPYCLLINNVMVLAGELSSFNMPGQALSAINTAAAGLGSIYTAELVDLTGFTKPIAVVGATMQEAI